MITGKQGHPGPSIDEVRQGPKQGECRAKDGASVPNQKSKLSPTR